MYFHYNKSRRRKVLTQEEIDAILFNDTMCLILRLKMMVGETTNSIAEHENLEQSTIEI